MHSDINTHIKEQTKKATDLQHTHTGTHTACSQGQTVLVNGEIKESITDPQICTDNIAFGVTRNTNAAMYLGYVFIYMCAFFMRACLLFMILRQIAAWP